MAAEERTLPLFPLNVVLFPNGALPLQIFEERYKQMLKDCLDGDSTFGVVLIKAGAEVGAPAIPYSVGTVARIAQVTEIRGGRFLVSVVGQRRFRIMSIAQYRPYMTAYVELLDDGADSWVPPAEMEAIRRAVTSYQSLALGLAGGWTQRARVPSDPAALSYRIGDMLQVRLAEKQALLEEPSAAKRLEAELDLLRRELEPLRERVATEMRKKFSKQ
ncbi:MAG: LON peptidase substrate-binding domain-containing protein [Chloroflexi bacterium]|nr:LON peptidase substrate-binding domain-containing protein [Chloroflexota bacterium]